MQTTIVKLYSDGKLAESIPVGDVEETLARRTLVDHVQQDSPEYTIATFRTHVVNRHQYMFVFLEPFRIDFLKFVNKLLFTSSQFQSIRDEDRQGYQQ
jgi:hypothetical protein